MINANSLPVQNSDAFDFVQGISPIHPIDPCDLLLIFNSGNMVVDPDGNIPERKFIETIIDNIPSMQYLGEFRNKSCYYGEISRPFTNARMSDIRTILIQNELSVFYLCCRALHILDWNRKNIYCGSCSGLMHNKPDERAKICPACNAVVYPRISPAVIVAVVKDNQILLARNRLSKLGFFSVLAGFAEPGETLEDCVRREVFEETKIRVKNIRYFGSQPWPFPDSLMIGFTADYDSGEIVIDKTELEVARWFNSGNMPDIPSAPSISRKLIEWFISNYHV
jgi:NAD+ diphosphatase